MTSATRLAAPPRVAGTPQTALALLRQREAPSRTVLLAAGFESLEACAQAVADSLKLPRLALEGVELGAELAQLLPRATVEKHRLLPVFSTPTEVTVATCDPTRLELFDWLERELRRRVLPVVSHAPELESAIARLYETVSLTVVSEDEEAEQAALAMSARDLEEASQVVDRLIARAVELRASDLHLEASAQGTVVRLRVDGMLRQVETRPPELHNALVSRIKVLASLDISERQAPQDGRIKLRRTRGDIDLRVSVLPTYYGEKVCCRILDNTRASLPLTELGFEPEALSRLERLVRAPYGLVLVTGPTGSGKSTTLYGALNAVRSPELNVVTVEDPVEYQLPGINQVQVNAKRGMTFVGALRAILRQDPNVILVGEIRDRETGALAAEAAMTGHLVLASLHTNDAPSAVTRLQEMGIEPYLLAPSLIGVLAQRLARKVCHECADAYLPDADELEALGLPGLPPGVTFRKGRGCEACLHTGHKGRTAVRELLEVDGNLRAAIGRGASSEELRRQGESAGFRGMRFEALRKLFAGEISSAEVLRLTRA
jgi:type IV pilus assembly protein PilB